MKRFKIRTFVESSTKLGWGICTLASVSHLFAEIIGLLLNYLPNPMECVKEGNSQNKTSNKYKEIPDKVSTVCLFRINLIHSGFLHSADHRLFSSLSKFKKICSEPGLGAHFVGVAIGFCIELQFQPIFRHFHYNVS